MKILRAYILAGAAFLLTGCPTYEELERTVVFDSDESGTFEMVMLNIGSTEADRSKREEDLAIFVFDMTREGFDFEHVTDYTLRVSMEEETVVVRVTGRFDTPEGVDEVLNFNELDRDGGGFIFSVTTDARVVATNGTLKDGGEGGGRITWPVEARRFHFKLAPAEGSAERAIESGATPVWLPEYSLLDEFTEYERDPVRFVTKEAAKRLYNAFDSIEKGDPPLTIKKRFDAVLRVDPYNETALKELGKLEEAGD